MRRLAAGVCIAKVSFVAANSLELSIRSRTKSCAENGASLIMPRRPATDDEDSDEESWDEAGWDEDFDDEDDDDRNTVPCPYCRQPVYEDAEYCANCDEYISLEDAPPERKPAWVVAVVLLLLSSMLFWIVLWR
jgi:hypothetical protein